MSEDVAAIAATEGPSAGTLLKRARESVGLHVATLAVALKVPVRKLEALEGDRYDELPDAVFARALASSVCRHLKIDPQPILERLPQSGRPRLATTSESINAPFRAPGDGPGPRWSDHLTRPVSLAVIALLVGALVITFLPTMRFDERAPEAVTSKAEPVMPPGSPTTVAIAPAEPVVPASAPAIAGTAPVATAAPVAAPAASASEPARPASAAGPTVAGPASTTGVVVFKTRSASWIQVVDAKGTTVLRRMLDAGETVGVNGTLPLSVIVGSAEATTVEVRGKPFNLGPVSRDNVARFEVK
jgi:cytoskeleton protein RodZ